MKQSKIIKMFISFWGICRVWWIREVNFILTVRRCLPCLKSLIPESLFNMHSRPPHCAITPAILYTSSSSSSSSEQRENTNYKWETWDKLWGGKKTENNVKKGSCNIKPTCSWVQRLNELLCCISQKPPHSVDDPHWLTLYCKEIECLNHGWYVKIKVRFYLL